MQGQIDYGNLMQRALRKIVAEVLAGVARDGLPGEHHFYISFDTRHPELRMADWLRERYPEDMTIVLQNFFEDLEVDERGFAVTLNFGDQLERLYVPFDAITTFVDPSVEFGLRFEVLPHDGGSGPEGGEEAPMASVEDSGEEGPEAEVVSLDQFRRR